MTEICQRLMFHSEPGTSMRLISLPPQSASAASSPKGEPDRSGGEAAFSGVGGWADEKCRRLMENSELGTYMRETVGGWANGTCRRLIENSLLGTYMQANWKLGTYILKSHKIISGSEPRLPLHRKVRLVSL